MSCHILSIKNSTLSLSLVHIMLGLDSLSTAMALLQLLFSLLITLLCTWGLVAGTCTTEATRRQALNKVLASQGCNHYQCGKWLLLRHNRATSRMYNSPELNKVKIVVLQFLDFTISTQHTR